VKVDDSGYSVSLWANPITEELRYGTHFQGITQFYLPLMRLSTNGMNHTCLFAFPAEACPYLPIPEGCKAELA